MKILFKYPSRSRPDRFFTGLDNIISMVANKNDYHILCTLDEDDPTMNNDTVKERLQSYSNTSVAWGLSKSKVDAFNRDMPNEGYDILVGMSDDMKFIAYGFDELFREGFRINAPDFDGYMHYPDQDAKHMLATLYVGGRTFYQRFGYIYHPSYLSVFCDNETQDVAQILGKYHYLGIPLVHHLNPAYGHLPRDEMFNRQQDMWNTDEANYHKRKLKYFDLPDEIILAYTNRKGA